MLQHIKFHSCKYKTTNITFRINSKFDNRYFKRGSWELYTEQYIVCSSGMPELSPRYLFINGSGANFNAHVVRCHPDEFIKYNSARMVANAYLNKERSKYY